MPSPATTLTNTIGALEIGIIFAIFLFGIFFVQVFNYSQANFKDALWLKLLVFAVWFLETAHTICILIVLYNITVTNYGVEKTIADAPFALDFSAVISTWIGAAIQSFFAYRVKVISGRLFIPIVSWTLSILRAGFGVLIGVSSFESVTLPRFIERWDWLVTTEFALSAAIDVLNTVSICYYLLRRRSEFHSSSKLVDKFLLFSIETGLLTSITVLTMLACALTMPANLIYIGILMPYAKLFSNSFMTSLNARQALRQKVMSVATSDQGQGNSIHVGRSTFTGVYVQSQSFSENRSVALELSRIDPETGKATSTRITRPQNNSFEDVESSRKISEF